MSNIFLIFISTLLLSAFISALVTILTYRFFVRQGWVEDPQIKQAKTKNATALYPVPRGGGVPIFIGIFIATLVFLPLDQHLFGSFWQHFCFTCGTLG
jgi:UDP-N-acetylmuramyl pentapeptide phosphotransferase/UDP-N-acetylglucosamine-1-phosphate transferase